jgi:aminoacyl tRNA synthase complex-interacting multifunctional protein 1
MLVALCLLFLQPSITPAGSSQSILGSAAVLSYLARLKNQLNAKTDEESAQIDQFLSLSAKLADELSSDATKGFTKLEQLSDTLASLTFLAGNKMTIADLALYAALAPAFQSLTTAQRFQIPRVSRHFDLIQRTLHSQPSGSKLPHPLVDIDLNRPATEVKKKEKKEDVSGKAEKPVASAPSAVVGAAAAPAKPAAAEKKAKEPKEAKAPKEPKAGGADKPAEAPADDKPDPSKIDFRVGLILSAEKHPNADSLYVEQIVGVFSSFYLGRNDSQTPLLHRT